MARRPADQEHGMSAIHRDLDAQARKEAFAGGVSWVQSTGHTRTVDKTLTPGRNLFFFSSFVTV